MSIRAEVDMGDIKKLQNLFLLAEKEAVHNTEGLIRQTIIFATQSAANATKPRAGRNKAGNVRHNPLRDKDLYRPLLPMPASMGFWYYQEGAYKPFKVKRKLKPKEVKAKKLKRITKAVKMWNRDGGGWKYLPYPGTKRNKNDRRFWIHRAGLAKLGWWRAAAALDKKSSVPNIRANKIKHGIHKVTKGFLYLEVANKVRYVSKSSPAAARYGINRARKRMEGIWLPKIDKKIERKLNR